MVSGVVPSPACTCLQFLSRIGFSIPTARRFSSNNRMLLTHAFALSARQFVHEKNSLRIYTSMPAGGLELTKLTYGRHEDNLRHHRGDRRHCQRLSLSKYEALSQTAAYVVRVLARSLKYVYAQSNCCPMNVRIIYPFLWYMQHHEQ